MRIEENGRKIRIGIIGLGARGLTQTKLIAEMQDVEIAVLCDVYEDRCAETKEEVHKISGSEPDIETDYHAVCARSDIEAVVINTSWETHIKIAIEALEHGIRPALEAGGASSLRECYRLVEASERTGVPVMILENCCYNKEEMTLLNMVRQNVFGTLVHCRGAYGHDLREEIGKGDIIRHYRLNNFLHRNGELYPTHEMGPIAKYLNLNRGNRMISLYSMSSKALGLHEWFKENRPESPFVDAQISEGDVVTTFIKCSGGETIVLTHDCTLPRPYSRGGYVQGTKGVWMEENRSLFIEGRSPVDPDSWTHEWESDKKYMEQYIHPLWQAYEEYGLRSGHGGMDYLTLRAFFESVQRRETPPIDVYDAVSWMSITCLSEESIAIGAPVPVPDFTNGLWTSPRHEKVTSIYALD